MTSVSKDSIIVLSFVFFSLLVHSQVMPLFIPEAYYGKAYVDGQLASKGTNITVRSTTSNNVVGHGVVIDDAGFFKVDIIFNNRIGNVTEEGAYNNEPVKWCINGFETSFPAPGEDKAESGEVNFDFRLELNTSKGTQMCDVSSNKAVTQNVSSPSKKYIAVIFLLFLMNILLLYTLIRVYKKT